jgi:hypothetical protein
MYSLITFFQNTHFDTDPALYDYLAMLGDSPGLWADDSPITQQLSPSKNTGVSMPTQPPQPSINSASSSSGHSGSSVVRVKRTRAARNSKKAPGSSPRPGQLGFYSHPDRDLFAQVKNLLRHWVVLVSAFPEKSGAVARSMTLLQANGPPGTCISLLPLNDFDLTPFSGRTYPGEVVAMVSKMS